MRIAKILLVLCFILFAMENAWAQRSRKVTKSRLGYSAPKVRGRKARIVCPVFERSRYPFHGLGFKLGDPIALTYKFYLNKHFSLAVDFGKPASGLYNDYFSGKFSGYAQKENLASPETQAVYFAHTVRSDLTWELKGLYHIDVSKLSDGLQVYLGAGWAWRATHLVYDFEYNAGDTPAEDPFGSFERHRRTMGPQVVAGLEYSYFSIPVAAFMEVEYFTDLQADPGWKRLQGGVGLRYVF